jgi:hypothetical protein
MDSFKCCEKCHESREQDARAVLKKRTSYFFLIKSQHHSIPWINEYLCVLVGTRIYIPTAINSTTSAQQYQTPIPLKKKRERFLFSFCLIPWNAPCPTNRTINMHRLSLSIIQCKEWTGQILTVLSHLQFGI